MEEPESSWPNPDLYPLGDPRRREEQQKLNVLYTRWVDVIALRNDVSDSKG